MELDDEDYKMLSGQRPVLFDEVFLLERHVEVLEGLERRRKPLTRAQKFLRAAYVRSRYVPTPRKPAKPRGWWQRENKERHKEHALASYYRNKEKRLAKMREWREKNPDYQRQYRERKKRESK